MLWTEKRPFPDRPAPLRGAAYVTIHKAEEDGYRFLLGNAVKMHGGILHAGWANSWRYENDERSMMAERVSYDGGATWSGVCPVAGPSGDGFCRSHGVYMELDGSLFAFCPRARFHGGIEYTDLRCERYELTQSGWEYRGMAVDAPFWPMCEPIMTGGRYLMAGLQTVTYQAAVALSDDGARWEMSELPNPDGLLMWGETTVIDRGKYLTAVIRSQRPDGKDRALVSDSLDYGVSWTPIRESNLPMIASKPYGGRLSTGEIYLVFNAPAEGRQDRSRLVIAVGRGSLERVYIIRDGFTIKPRFGSRQEWSYPYAAEAGGRLYVSYNANKEDAELAVIPVGSLTA